MISVRRLAILAFTIMLLCLLCGVAGGKTPTPSPQVVLSSLGSISGVVYDAEHNGVPMANVTLYHTKWNGYEYVRGSLAKVKDNPQYTGDGSRSPAGSFAYTSIPTDIYVLYVDKDGVNTSILINVKYGTNSQDIVLDGYTMKSTPSPPPSMANSTSPLPGFSEGYDAGAVLLNLFRILLISIVSIQFILGVAILLLFTSHR